MPKIHSNKELNFLSEHIEFPAKSNASHIRAVTGIESARSLWNVGNIAQWKCVKEGLAIIIALLAIAVLSQLRIS
jgi:citrate lyase beta subunit